MRELFDLSLYRAALAGGYEALEQTTLEKQDPPPPEKSLINPSPRRQISWEFAGDYGGIFR